MVAAGAAAHSRRGAAQHTGPPLRPQGCWRTACGGGPAGRPWPRRPRRPLTAGNQGQAGACPRTARHPATAGRRIWW